MGVGEPQFSRLQPCLQQPWPAQCLWCDDITQKWRHHISSIMQGSLVWRLWFDFVPHDIPNLIMLFACDIIASWTMCGSLYPPGIPSKASCRQKVRTSQPVLTLSSCISSGLLLKLGLESKDLAMHALGIVPDAEVGCLSPFLQSHTYPLDWEYWEPF